MSEKHITLEVGPDKMPMHHRSTQELQLKEGEFYIGLDLGKLGQTTFDNDFWEKARSDFKDKLNLVYGNRSNLPIANESIHELVALGSTGMKHPETLLEYNRVLKSGGILRMGVAKEGEEQFDSAFEATLSKLGFIELPEERQEYLYAPNGKAWPYVVRVFKKPDSQTR